jgi:hypothetical protein
MFRSRDDELGSAYVVDHDCIHCKLRRHSRLC